MPGSAFSVEIEALGVVQINRRLLRFGERAGNPRPAFLAVSEYLNEVEKAQFASEGAYSGHPWAKLAESTVAHKRAAGLRPEILRATDAMFKALTQKSNKNKKRLISKTTLVQGVQNLSYPEILMKKDAADGSGPRKPVDLTELNKVVIIKIIQAWIVSGVPGKVPAP